MMVFFANRVPPKARDAYRKDTVSGMLGAVMLGLTAPFIAVIARKVLHASAVEIAILSMAPVAGNLFSLLWANIMEGRRKMPFAVWSWIAARSMLLLTAFAQSSGLFVGMISAYYFIASIASPAYSAIMKEVYPDGDRARIMGYARVCTIGVYVLVTAMASSFLAGHNYRIVFPIAGLFGIASVLSFARIHSMDNSGNSSVPLIRFIRDGLLILRDDRGFRWFCTGIFIFGFANFMAQPAQTIYAVDIGVDTRWAGFYSILSASAMIIAYFYWGAYTDRKRPEAVIALQAGCWALIPLNYAVATKPWMLIPTAIISGVIGAGIELSYFTGVLRFAPSDRITQYQAIFLSLMAIRGILAPFLGALLQKPELLGEKGVFIVAAAMILSSVIVQLIGMCKYKSQVSNC